MRYYNRCFLFVAGLFGALGVAAYAAAAHIGGYYTAIAPILFGNGVALLFLAYNFDKTIFKIAGLLLVIGVLLFAGDVFFKQITLHHLFPFAAPAGGVILIIAWLLMAGASFSKRNFL